MSNKFSKFDFELALESAAEKFYFYGATQYGKKRGGNSSENEAYFRSFATNLRESLDCQQILIKKGACPDSGILGNFGLKNDEDVDWKAIENSKIVILEFSGASRQTRYMEIAVDNLNGLPSSISKKSGINIQLHDLLYDSDCFGVEYKASQNNSESSIQVASFNSTCPCKTKTVVLRNIKMIHNLNSKAKATEVMGHKLKKCDVDVYIKFYIYYLIVNDYPSGDVSEIKKIFICSGDFFAPNTDEETANNLSRQLHPEDLNISYSLYRVKLRYRPFFDSKTIKASGYGLYTSWEPRIASLEKEERQRARLLAEIEVIQQNFADDFLEVTENTNESDSGLNQCQKQQCDNLGSDSPELSNVIYLALKEERIKKRAA